MDKVQNSIIKKYRKEIYRPFVKTIREFNLIEENDIIAVCISGGKDSFLLAKCMEEFSLHGPIKFQVKYILMNPGFSKEYLKNIKDNAKKLNIKLHIFRTKIFDQISNSKDYCYLCARKRRGALYNEAKILGCNKIALGHHFDDVCETILMSLIYNGEFKTMKPILSSVNYKPLKLIRPLYYVKESDILSWVEYNNLKFNICGCLVVKNRTNKRYAMKDLIKYLNIIHKDASINIVNSTKDVNLKTIISSKK